MKVSYVKFNSERNPKFALKTVIFKQNSQQFVAKEALNEDAKEHIKRIQDAEDQLSQQILSQQLTPVNIIEQTDVKVIFPFIEGESFEKKLQQEISQNGDIQGFWQQYTSMIRTAFKTTPFEADTMATPLMKELFGEQDYTVFNGLESFCDVTNLDLIFSNLIESNKNIYIIDYEWTFPVSLPLDFVLYRTKRLYEQTYNIVLGDTIPNAKTFEAMDRHFIDNVVMKDGFYFYKNNYLKVNTPIQEHIKIKEEHIGQLQNHVKALVDESKRIQEHLHGQLREVHDKLHNTGKELIYAQKVVELRDRQIDSLRIKNRLKRFLSKFIPGKQDEIDPLAESIEFDKLFPPKPTTYIYNTPHKTAQIDATMQLWEQKPLCSILMPVYNVDPKWLQKAIESVQNQWYEKWELCIVDDKSTNEATLSYLHSIDDPRIKIKFAEVNKNIAGASNDAASMASGEYILLLDNDDELTPDALYEMVKKINESNADFIYSDEDFMDTEGNCHNPHYKPDFSPDLLLSHNYITHLSCFKRSLFEEVGMFDERFSGSQDYDLFLKMTEKANKVEHIPKVLYHWRMIEGSTSADSKAKPEALQISKQVLEETLKRRGIDGWVENGNIDHYFRVRYVIKNEPLVSIIIPFKDKPELLSMCVHSILEKSTYKNFEIIGVSNNSEEEETFKLMKELEKLDKRVKFYEYNIEFNYAQINNYAVEHYAKGEHVLLLNNDIEVITPEWIEAMLEHSQRKEIGCVGAKLYYPNDTVQHAGIIMGLGGYAGHSHKMSPRESQGYFNRLNTIQNLSAVTAACLMIEKSIYEEVNGMDAENFKVAYNDVDFCLRVMEKGYRNLFTPYAEMYHHESVSRGYETTPEKIARFDKEKEALYKRHKAILENGDPYYNPNLTHSKEDFSICLD
ncbi:MAG: glycosyltransferase family 2 protein [Epsilonproteobacteria bacterium]|nr:glycosyltransferase family 2 protein [Campylobacterota bacterium]